MKRVIVGITGASGSAYAVRLLEVLNDFNIEVHAVVTDSGWQVLEHECGLNKADIAGRVHRLYPINQIGAGIASGSFIIDAMVVVPGSMRTIGSLASGVTDTLLTRAADVMLKEGRPLMLVPRETPLHAIHLENMLKLARAGAIILPAAPGFYHKPQTVADLVDMLVGKILDRLGLKADLFTRWQ